MDTDEKGSVNETDGYVDYLAGKYPWFDAANRLLTDGAAQPVHIALSDGFRPSASEVDMRNFFNNILSGKDEPLNVLLPDDDIITKFMERDDYRITVREDTPEISPEAVFSDDAEEVMYTEELASIYMDQGCFAEAVKIYGRLSLLYPEKSIYFAEIIHRANALKAAKQEL